MADQFRITRLIQYIGDRDWVEDQVRRSIHGSRIMPKGIISAVTLEDFPAKLDSLTSEALLASLNEIGILNEKIQQLSRLANNPPAQVDASRFHYGELPVALDKKAKI